MVALGSNMRIAGIGNPRAVLAEALRELARQGLHVLACSDTIITAPIGPSQRQYANAVAIIESALTPAAMLDLLLSIERRFGRRRLGQIWRARPLDCDIILWSGGIIAAPDITIPHPRFRERGFVLHPAAQIAGDWRDPITGRTIRQLAATSGKARRFN